MEARQADEHLQARRKKTWTAAELADALQFDSRQRRRRTELLEEVQRLVAEREIAKEELARARRGVDLAHKRLKALG